MNLNKTELKAFRDDFAQAVKALEAKYGVKMALGNISYTQTEFHTKLTVTNVSATGEAVVDPQVLKIKTAKAAFALKSTHLGMDFQIPEVIIGRQVRLASGKIGTIIDFDSKKFKFPFIIEINGTEFKIPGGAIQVFL